MRSRSSRWVLALALAGFALLPAWAEQRSKRGMGMGEHHNYDVAAETNIKGTVTEVKQAECDVCGNAMGTHLVLKTEGESIEVMLGPSSFLAKKGVVFSEGDEIEVTGAKTNMGGDDVLLAREVKRGDKTVTLRDKMGRPKWAGRRGPRS